MNDTPNASPEFPEYAIKYSRGAVESRSHLDKELLPLLAEIIDGLAFDPDKYPARLRPVSRDGKNFIYVHPNPEIQVTFERDDQDKVLYFFHFSAPSFQVNKSIFVSYSHEDSQWLATLKTFLGVLEQQGLMEFWDDSKIEAGDKWLEEIEAALTGAHAAVLLVSQSFLASDFVSKVELPRILSAAEESGTKIFWIPLSPSTVFDSHKEIAAYQSLLSDPSRSLEELADTERKKQMVEMSKTLSRVVSKA